MIIKVFIKKHWFKECKEILSLIEQELSRSQPKTIGSPNENSSAAITKFTTDKRLLKLWELRASFYYHSCQYSNSLFCVDIAITQCPPAR